MLSKQQIENKIIENLHYFDVREEADEYNAERDVMKLSIGFTVLFHKGHTEQVRRLLPPIVKSFLDKFGKHITGGVMTNKESQKYRAVKMSDKLLKKCLDVNEWIKDCEEGIELFFDSTDQEATTGWALQMVIQESYTSAKDLSYIHVAMPYQNIAELNKLTELLNEICQKIDVHSGYGGYWLSLPDQFYSYQEHQTPVAYRFYGCEIDSFMNYRLINEEPIGIKGINWLTILGKTFIDKMGGQGVLTQMAQELGLGVENAGQNMIIQAGDYPDICDNEDLPMNPFYVAINHLLKPIRKESIGSLHMGSASAKSVMGDAASDEWLRRFDQYPMPDMSQYAAKTSTETKQEPKIEPPPSRYTGYAVEVGQVCQETGSYECPRMEGRIVVLMQGQTVLGDKYNQMGAIIWYKLTKEAESEHLKKRWR